MGAYSLRDAALLLRIPYGKLRRWAEGYWYSVSEDDRFSEPVVPGRSDEVEERVLSFLELMELAVIAFYRSQGVSMQVVREARTQAQHLFDTEFPFATRRLQTDGKGIFAALSQIEGVPDGRLQIELSNSQLTHSDLIEPFFRNSIDFGRDGLALAYWPLGREKPILLDSRRAFGRPIVTRVGTPTFVLFQMREGGESTERIAAWYGLTQDEVEIALEFEQHIRTAA
jgi:uncharacterized protein (DUF433 family)/GNAT superfamily N-acetyltransferase